MTAGAAQRTAARFFSNKGKACNFNRLHVHIGEEDGAFTVRVRMLNHLKVKERAFGEEIAATFEWPVRWLACSPRNSRFRRTAFP